MCACTIVIRVCMYDHYTYVLCMHEISSQIFHFNSIYLQDFVHNTGRNKVTCYVTRTQPCSKYNRVNKLESAPLVFGYPMHGKAVLSYVLSSACLFECVCMYVCMYTNIVQRAFFLLLHKRKEQSGYSKKSH